MSSTGIFFPHQIFDEHEILIKCDSICLIEEYLFFHQFNFHKQKLAFHRASMRSFLKRLESRNIDVEYIDCNNPLSDIRELIRYLKKIKIKSLHYINPTDNWLERRISSTAKDEGIVLVEYENPLFLNSRRELDSFFKRGKKSFFQTSFYKQQRQKRSILLDNEGKPTGGKWTYDTDNRKKFPEDQPIPGISYPSSDHFWKEAVDYINTYYPNNPGSLSESPIFPYTPEQSEKWFKQFLNSRFHLFGDYEDAIVKDEMILHHSAISPMLNTGLISPEYVLDKILKQAKEDNMPINSVEGFIRQIVGWREFIRGMYEFRGSYSRTRNFWGYKRKIPGSFYDGTTGIVPLDTTIRKVLRTGYCHHIERLMILGNFMLLCEFDPDDVYCWFMELFIDAYDWVMVPNVYGMSQFADGGLFASKPYISGSNYIMKMSNYEPGKWQEIWDGLFWRFMDINRDFFTGNPRLSMLVRSFDRMNGEKKARHLDNANEYLESLDTNF